MWYRVDTILIYEQLSNGRLAINSAADAFMAPYD